MLVRIEKMSRHRAFADKKAQKTEKNTQVRRAKAVGRPATSVLPDRAWNAKSP